MNLTQQEFKDKIDSNILIKAGALLSAKAMVETIREVVRGYQVKILTHHQFTNKAIIERYNKRADRADFAEPKVEVVLNPERTYMMSDEDFAIYLKECVKAKNEAGLITESDDHCPLLVAEDVERLARIEFIDAMSVITNMPFQAVLRCKNGLEKVYKLEALYLKTLSSMGFFDKVKVSG